MMLDATAPLRNDPSCLAPLSDWFAAFGPSASADNAAAIIKDPYNVAALLDPLSRGLGDAGGRTAIWSGVQTGYLVWPMLSAAGTTGRIQVWDLALAPRGPVALGAEGRKTYPGVPRNRCYEIPGSSGAYLQFTANAASAESFKLGLLDERFPYIDLDAGTQWYPRDLPYELPFRGDPLSVVTAYQIPDGVQMLVLMRAF